MAKYAASGTRVYLDEFNLSGSLASAGLDISQETAITTSFADAGPRRLVGNYDFSLPFVGFFESADDGYDEQIFALLGDGLDHYITLLLGANAAGSIAYDGIGQVTGEPRSAAVGGAIALNFDIAGSGGLSRGLVLANKTTVGAENLTGYNLGATGAGTQFRVIYRVLAFDGTDITLHIEESTDLEGDPDTYEDIAGLTETFTDIGVASDTVVIATEAYKRVVVSGTFTSALILVTAGNVQGTYIAP